MSASVVYERILEFLPTSLLAGIKIGTLRNGLYLGKMKYLDFFII
jgi:hypothetical protein